jgi:hypothetical protein
MQSFLTSSSIAGFESRLPLDLKFSWFLDQATS